MTNVQNMWNLIGREEYNIGCIVLSALILYSLTKKTTTFEFYGEKNQEFTNQKKTKKNSNKSLLLIKNYLYTNEIVTIDKELIKNKNLFFWIFLIPLINNKLVNGRYLVRQR